jgi:hypothetical protein
VLFLVCGGVIAVGAWAVNSLMTELGNAATNLAAQMTSKAPVPVEAHPAVGEKPVGNGLDVRFVPSDFVAGIVVNGNVLKSPVVTGAVPDDAIRRMGQDWGIDPLKVERAVLLIEPTPGGNVGFFPGGIIRFSEPVDGKAVLSKVLTDLQEASANGKAYFNSKSEKMAGAPMSGHVADERTILIAPEPTLKKMLAAKGDGPLAKQLQRVNLESHLAAAFVMEPVRALAKEAAKDAKGELPPNFAEVATLPDRVKGGTLALNLSGDSLLIITLDTENDESADVVVNLLGQGKDALKQALPDLRKGLAESLPPELSKDVLDLVEKVPDNLLISRNGPTVSVAVVTLKSPGALEALAKKAAALANNPGGQEVKPVVPAKPVGPAKPAASLPPKPLPKRTESGDSLKGDVRAVMDVTATTVKLVPQTTLPCLTWADDKGSAFYALDAGGDLRRVSYPDLKEEWKQSLGAACAWLSLSAEGLLVTQRGGAEVWLIDPATGEMKRRFAMPNVKRAASAAGSSVAVASAGDGLYVLDLKNGTFSKYVGPRPKFGGMEDPVLTPDGKYLFTDTRLGQGDMHRWAIADGRLKLDESSGHVAQGRVDSGVTVSPDSKWVCFPSYVGGGDQPHKNYTLCVFAVGDLKAPAFVLDPGGTAVAFDPAGGYIYTQNLRLFDYDGKFLKEYKLGAGPPMVTTMGQILPHPAGSALLMIGDNKVLAVEVPKKKAGAGGEKPAKAPGGGTVTAESPRPRPSGGPAANEDPEVTAYVKKKGWTLFNDQRISDGKRLTYLSVPAPGTLTADDYKMIARSKTAQVLDLRFAKTTDDGLKTVSAIPQLEGIIVGGDDVTDAGVKALAGSRSLDNVSLFTKKVTDAGVKALAALPNLRALYLGFMTLDGSAFEAFAGSKTLQSVTLEYVDGFTDEGAKNLAKLPNLNELKIGGGFGERKLTTAGIRAIVDAHVPARFDFDKKLLDDDLFEVLVARGWLYGPAPPSALGEKKPATPAEVKYLVLSDSKVTDKGLRAVLNCTNVNSLYLNGTGVTDETLKKMSGFKDLQYLALGHTKVTAAGIGAVSGLPIKHVAMEGCELSEDAFKEFGKMAALEELWLPDAKMKADWLKHIARLPKLRDLNLMRADFDDAAVKHVTTLPSLASLTLNDTNLGDTGFQELLKMPKLQSLYVDSTKVTKEVYQKAKKENPKRFLYFYRYDQPGG